MKLGMPSSSKSLYLASSVRRSRRSTGDLWVQVKYSPGLLISLAWVAVSKTTLPWQVEHPGVLMRKWWMVLLVLVGENPGRLSSVRGAGSLLTPERWPLALPWVLLSLEQAALKA